MPGRGVEVGIDALGLAPRKVEFADPRCLFYIPTTGSPAASYNWARGLRPSDNYGIGFTAGQLNGAIKAV